MRKSRSASAIRRVSLGATAAALGAVVGVVGGTAGPVGASSPPTIHIGFEATLSGALGTTGSSFAHGAKVAVAEINQSGGVTIHGKRYNFTLDICNDNSDQTQVAACADKLVQTDGDLFMFGGLADYGPIVHGITEAKHVIYFSTGSAVAALMPTSHFTVNTVPSLASRSLMSVRAFHHLYPNVKTVALLGNQDATDAAAFAQDKVAFKAVGLKLVGEQIAPDDVTDFSSLLTALKAKHPGVIWNELAANQSSEQEMLGQNAQLQASKLVFNNSGSCLPTYPHTPGITYMAQTNTGAISVGPLEPALEKQYQVNYYKVPGAPQKPDPNINTALFIYDFFPMLRNAIEKAGTSTNVSAVLKALNSEKYTGINGKIGIAHDQASYGQVICKAPNGNGKFSEIKAEPNGSLSSLSG